MLVELLYFDGCPGRANALRLVQQVLSEERAPAQIREINVRSEEEARAYRFIGSPTVRVDGKDVDPRAERVRDFGRRCRLYLIDGSLSGIPSRAMIRRAVREAAR